MQSVGLGTNVVACQKLTRRFKQGDHRVINPAFYRDDQPFFINDPSLDRRGFLKVGGAAVAVSLLSRLGLFAQEPVRQAEYRVDFTTQGKRDPGINLIVI